MTTAQLEPMIGMAHHLTHKPSTRPAIIAVGITTQVSHGRAHGPTADRQIWRGCTRFAGQGLLVRTRLTAPQCELVHDDGGRRHGCRGHGCPYQHLTERDVAIAGRWKLAPSGAAVSEFEAPACDVGGNRLKSSHPHRLTNSADVEPAPVVRGHTSSHRGSVHASTVTNVILSRACRQCLLHAAAARRIVSAERRGARSAGMIWVAVSAVV